MNTLAHFMALRITPADAGNWVQMPRSPEELQQATGSTVELAYVDQGCTGEATPRSSQRAGARLEVTQAPHGQTGLPLLPLRWVVERSFACEARFRCLARDYEPPHTTLKGFHSLLRLPHARPHVPPTRRTS